MKRKTRPIWLLGPVSALALLVIVGAPYQRGRQAAPRAAEGFALAQPAAPPTQQCSVTDLGPLLEIPSWACSINAHGQIVGKAHGRLRGGWPGLHLFICGGGLANDLGSLGDSAGDVRAINSLGHVVGWSNTRAGEQHAFLYRGGTMRDLGTLGGTLSEACAINNSGAVVGASRTRGNGAEHAFLWRDGRMNDLGTLGGSESHAFGINDSGQVVGKAATASGFEHAFLCSAGVMRDLGTLGGRASCAYAINNAGQVVGASERADGSWHVFLYSGSVMRDIDTLNRSDSVATRINRSGQAVGRARTADGIWRPVLWNKGVMKELSELLPRSSGWVLGTVSDINDTGQIVGSGFFRGRRHALLLTPMVRHLKARRDLAEGRQR